LKAKCDDRFQTLLSIFNLRPSIEERLRIASGAANDYCRERDMALTELDAALAGVRVRPGIIHVSTVIAPNKTLLLNMVTLPITPV
jgi:hypothetical protein